MRQAIHKMQAHSPLAMVEVPGHAPRMQQVYHQKVELEQACLEEAGRWFTQAKQTPLLTSPLVDIFGKCGDPKEVAQTLTGTMILPTLSNPYMVKFLVAMACPKDVEDITPQSTQAYCCGWRKARETMGSSTSRIHFGHYIAGTFNPEILVINAALANIPLHTRFSYKRWKKGLNVMIKKTSGDFNVENAELYFFLKQTSMLTTSGSAVQSCTRRNKLIYSRKNSSAVGNTSPPYTNVSTNNYSTTSSDSSANWRRYVPMTQKVVTIESSY